MSTSTPQANSEELQLPAPEAQAELSAGPAEAIAISSPLQNLENAKTFPEAKEIMEALVKDGILAKVKEGERELYKPTLNNEKPGEAMIDAFKQTLKRIRDSERESRKNRTPEKNVKETRNQARKVVASKPKIEKAKHEKAQHERAPELILIDPKDYHKLDLLKDESRPLPESRLTEAAQSILLPYDRSAALATLKALVIAQSEALAQQISRQVNQIKSVNTYARLNEITDALVKQGLLIRRGRDLVANPNFGSTEDLENAIRSKGKEIETFLEEYKNTANDPDGLEITIERSRRVGKETKTFSDRYAVRFALGGKTIQLVKVMKFYPNSENLNLDTNRSYIWDALPKWFKEKYATFNNGQISLKKEAPKTQRQEPLMAIKRQPVAQSPAPTENKKDVSTPEAKAKDPLAESVAHLNQLIVANKELQIITKLFKAYREQIKPETIHPSLTVETLDEILRDAFELKEGQPTPRSLRDLIKISVESKWKPEDLLNELTAIAESLKISIKELPEQEEASTAKQPAEEKAA